MRWKIDELIERFIRRRYGAIYIESSMDGKTRIDAKTNTLTTCKIPIANFQDDVYGEEQLVLFRHSPSEPLFMSLGENKRYAIYDQMVRLARLAEASKTPYDKISPRVSLKENYEIRNNKRIKSEVEDSLTRIIPKDIFDIVSSYILDSLPNTHLYIKKE